MGLDMYLDAKRSFYKANYKIDSDRPEDKIELEYHDKIRKLFPEIYDSDNLRYIYVSFEAGYWRKANAIHKWFVDNVQRGKDDCHKHYVERDKLKELRSVCEKVLDVVKVKKTKINNGYTLGEGGKKIYNKVDGLKITNPAAVAKLLPTEDGFFFGSTDYDEWYLNDVKDTIKILDKALSLPEEWVFDYQSSW